MYGGPRPAEHSAAQDVPVSAMPQDEAVLADRHTGRISVSHAAGRYVSAEPQDKSLLAYLKPGGLFMASKTSLATNFFS